MYFVRLLASYGASNVTRFIGLSFRRPLPIWSVIAESARKFLDNVATGRLLQGDARIVAPNVELEYLCAAAHAGEAFHLGIVNDDSGGWIFEQLEHNIRLCINNKTRKAAPYRVRYPEWRLVLIDQIAYGLFDHNHQQQFRKDARIAHNWDKIIIVSSIDPKNYFEP